MTKRTTRVKWESFLRGGVKSGYLSAATNCCILRVYPQMPYNDHPVWASRPVKMEIFPRHDLSSRGYRHFETVAEAKREGVRIARQCNWGINLGPAEIIAREAQERERRLRNAK